MWRCRQYYKLQKRGDRSRLDSSVAMRDCVDRCASALRAAVEMPPTDPLMGHHQQQQPAAAAAESSGLPSVTPDESFVSYAYVDDGSYHVLAVCTPLMKRVHRLVPHAADVVVADASPPADKRRRRRCRVVLLATGSSAGGLPLGLIAASSDAGLPRAVRLFADLLDARCFFGRGRRGPTLLLVDPDCPALRAALTDVFAGSACLLCPYRLLASYWRLVWDRRAAAAGGDERARCFAVFRSAVFADSVVDLHARFADAHADPAVLGCAASHAHLLSVYERRADWSVCCQASDWPARGVARAAGGTRGLCVYASRALRDSAADHLRSLLPSLPALLAFVPRCDRYYARRLADTVRGSADDASALRFLDAADQDVPADVRCTVASSQFAVTLRSSSSVVAPGPMCHVDLTVGVCSCSAGGACVHQWAAIRQVRAASWLLRPVDSAAVGHLLTHIATGRGVAEWGWFASSHPLMAHSSDQLAPLFDDDTDTAPQDSAPTQLGTAASAAHDETVTVQLVAASSDSPPATAAADNKHVVIDWNGFAYEVSRDVVLKKKWGRLKQDLDNDLQLHRILILLY